MRISDWSSDCCSSDLPVVHVQLRHPVDKLISYANPFWPIAPIARRARASKRGSCPLPPAPGLKAPHQHRKWETDQPDQSRYPCRVCEPPLPRFAAETKRILRSEEHTSELQSLMRTSYAVFCLKKKTTKES